MKMASRLMYVAVDLVRTSCRVAPTKVVSSSPVARRLIEPPRRPCRGAYRRSVAVPDLGPHRAHGPVGWPSVQIERPRHFQDATSRWWNPKNQSHPCPGEASDPGLLGVQPQPEPAKDFPGQARAASALAWVGQTTTKSSAYLMSTPRRCPVRCHASSSTWSAMLAINGEIGDPWGSRHRSGDRTVFQHPRPKPASEQLEHRSVRHPPLNGRIKASWSICPKQSDTSASRIHVCPRLTSALTTSRA